MSGHEHSGEAAHGHEHGGYDVDPNHHHPSQPDLEDTPLAYHQVLQMAVASLLVEKGVFSADDMRAQIERMDALSPARGARLVARAWVDDRFRERLLADSKAAAAELGIDLGPVPILVMENNAETHNVVVCTLCSCYPRFLLGRPPDWYKSRSYRSRAVREPRRVLAEFGTDIDPERRIRVHDSTADMRYMIPADAPGGHGRHVRGGAGGSRDPGQPHRGDGAASGLISVSPVDSTVESIREFVPGGPEDSEDWSRDSFRRRRDGIPETIDDTVQRSLLLDEPGNLLLERLTVRSPLGTHFSTVRSPFRAHLIHRRFESRAVRPRLGAKFTVGREIQPGDSHPDRQNRDRLL